MRIGALESPPPWSSTPARPSATVSARTARRWPTSPTTSRRSAGVFPDGPWTSGFDLAEGVDLLIHDAQYFPDERAERVGWGQLAVDRGGVRASQGVRRLACFHHDPAHDDATLDRLVAEVAGAAPGVEVIGAREGAVDLALAAALEAGAAVRADDRGVRGAGREHEAVTGAQLDRARRRGRRGR